MLSGLIFLQKSVQVGIHINSENYGIYHTCYPYTPILILLPPKKIQNPTVLSSSLITAVGSNLFLFDHQAKLSDLLHKIYNWQEVKIKQE